MRVMTATLITYKKQVWALRAPKRTFITVLILHSEHVLKPLFLLFDIEIWRGSPFKIIEHLLMCSFYS
jgi:hypothetical protein